MMTFDHLQVVRAQEAGAVGVIVTDEDTDNDELFISMADDTTGREANIPAAFVLGKNGYRGVSNVQLLIMRSFQLHHQEHLVKTLATCRYHQYSSEYLQH